MSRLLDWLDHRTGIREISRAALYEHIPGGARWRYVWGSTLLFTFVVQMITGFFLWTAYAPSSQTAWESVYYIQHQMQGGPGEDDLGPLSDEPQSGERRVDRRKVRHRRPLHVRESARSS